MARRGRGEGAIAQLHGARWGCPEPIAVPNPETGTAAMVRPKHRCTGPWRATVDLGSAGGKRRRVTVQRPTKRELMEARDELLADIGGGIEPSRITVGEWLDTWMETATLKPYTRRGYEGLIRNHLKPALGRIPLRKLLATDVRLMVVEMQGRELSAQTISNARTVLRRALTIAVRDRLITHNPATHVELPKVETTPHAILTPEQARAVIDHATEAGERARLMVALMAGLRQGEALGLRWSDVDLEAGLMWVTRTMARVKGEWVEGTPKSRRSTREIRMAAALTHALLIHRGDSWEPDAFVFPGKDGDPVMPKVDHDIWKSACRRAGVPEVPLHGARGTLETMLIHAGVTMTDSAAMLGHDPVTAARHYARATQASQAALAAQVETLLGGPPALEP